MKPIAILLFLSFILYPSSFVFAQGPLSPTAAPAPTMKTLQQIEPRTPISALPATITASGSYYVTTNLTGVAGSTNGITILANDVTLDLSGFTLLGVVGSGSGITVPNSVGNLVIRNGVLDSWTQRGVYAASAYNSQFERLRVSNSGFGPDDSAFVVGSNSVVLVCTANGNSDYGFNVGNNCTIQDCTANGNGAYGFNAPNNCVVSGCIANGNSIDGMSVGINCTVKDCIVSTNGVYGIVASNGCVVADCSASGNLSDGINVENGTVVRSCASSRNGNNGITAVNNCTVSDCTASGDITSGISVSIGCTVKDCTANGNSQVGIYVGNGCQIAGNTCRGNTVGGIYVNSAHNRVDGNHVADNTQYGIDSLSANVGNSITRNSAPGNGTNYLNYADNTDYAPTGSVSTATNPWTNF